ncbi:MAG: efflux RND transporter periplasmic adaptor subunit [bacterium]
MNLPTSRSQSSPNPSLFETSEDENALSTFVNSTDGMGGLQKGKISGKSDNNRKKILFISIPVILLAIFLLSNFIFSEDPDMIIPSATVKLGDVTIKVTETGDLRARDQVTISSGNDKQILWLAPEGSWVEEGDTLVIYESEKYVIAKSEAESTVEIARANIISALSEVESQKAKEEAALKRFETIKNLAEEGFAVQSEVDQVRLTHIDLKNRTRSLEAAVDAARANMNRAERFLDQQNRKLREGFILAPRAGLVVYATIGAEGEAKKITVGMIPFEGMDLMYLPDVSSMMVDVEISEVDLSKIKIHLPAKISLDAYPDAEFDGEVNTIADLAKKKISKITGKPTGAKVFDVEVKVNAEDERLKPGLSATVDIIVNERKSALYIPLEAVFIDELDRTTVYVRQGDKIEKRVVSLGESNDRVIIVLDGLKEGDELLLGRPSNI